MARDTKAAALALHRFGLGPRAGAIEAIGSDPQSALLAEFDRPDAGTVAAADLPSSGAAYRAVFEFNAEHTAKDKLERRHREAAQRLAENDSMGNAMATQPEAPPTSADRPEPVPLPRRIFLDEAKARFDAAIGAEIGFVESLVWFWSNHFCVNADATVMAGGYEREAIRPHILGRFADMLLAVEGHPAMLVYLNNSVSIGPNSVAGINRTRGLNENLAREILELHTLGVRSGYTQDDVTRFACVLTGWTVISPNDNPEHGAEFIFNRRLHEPGPQRVIDKTYADTGVEQGRAVLADLARHPAVAVHVAGKLARHFVADEPRPELIERLARIFRDTDGDLKETAKGLITSEEAWAPEQGKLKRPCEWSVAMIRAAATRGDPERFVRGLVLLGEPLWSPSAPKGFADDEATWIDGVGQRLDIANNLAQRLADRIDPLELIETALGPLASNETRQAVARAESRQQALALVFMSPEFQRR